MSKSVEIRPATPTDRARLRSFHQSLYQSHRDQVVPSAIRALIAYRDYDQVLESDLDALLADRACYVLVADVDGEAVGYITARTRIESQRVASRRATVEDWYVSESHRGHGIGAALLGALEAKLRDLGCEVLESGTWATNEGARRAHQALGFHETRVSYRKRLG